jgi:hypothetical protein
MEPLQVRELCQGNDRVVGVEPEVELPALDGRSSGDTHSFLKLCHAKEILLGVAMLPAKEDQKVDYRLREKQVPQFPEAKAIVALAQLPPMRVQEQADMRELRGGPSEGVVETRVLPCRNEPLISSDDVRDVHEMVVDYIGEMVRRQAVAL